MADLSFLLRALETTARFMPLAQAVVDCALEEDSNERFGRFRGVVNAVVDLMDENEGKTQPPPAYSKSESEPPADIKIVRVVSPLADINPPVVKQEAKPVIKEGKVTEQKAEVKETSPKNLGTTSPSPMAPLSNPFLSEDERTDLADKIKEDLGLLYIHQAQLEEDEEEEEFYDPVEDTKSLPPLPVVEKVVEEAPAPPPLAPPKVEMWIHRPLNQKL